MKIEEIQYKKVTDHKSIRATAKVYFEDFAINGFKILQGKNGIFASVPQMKEGEAWVDIFSVDPEVKKSLLRKVAADYEQSNLFNDEDGIKF